LPLETLAPLIAANASSSSAGKTGPEREALWATPTASDSKRAISEAEAELKSKQGSSLSHHVAREQSETQAQKLWPTATASAASRGAVRRGRNAQGGPSLAEAVEMDESETRAQKLWPTATRSDAKGSRRNTARTDAWALEVGETLLDAVRLEAQDFYPTPTATSYGSTNNGSPHDGRTQYATKGTLSLDSMARQQWSGVLNPDWVEILLGTPPGWTASMPTGREVRGQGQAVIDQASSFAGLQPDIDRSSIGSPLAPSPHLLKARTDELACELSETALSQPVATSPDLSCDRSSSMEIAMSESESDPNQRLTSESSEWFSPSEIVDPAREVLGGFDLDPASCTLANLTIGATHFFSERGAEWSDKHNGFTQPWSGRVWLNPPGGSCDGEGRRMVKRKKNGPPCTESGACGQRPGHTHTGAMRSSAKAWWQKLEAEHASGSVSQAMFLAYSIELFQTAQVDVSEWARTPLDFPFCLPKNRLSYTDESGKPVRGNTHSSAIVFLPPAGPEGIEAVARFEKIFSDIGKVIVPAEWRPSPSPSPEPRPSLVRDSGSQDPDTNARTFRNEYLSVSRLKFYESCAAAFKHRYILKTVPFESDRRALDFGTFLHAVMEDLFRWVLDEEHSGPLPEDKMVELYRARWPKSQLTGLETFQEGLQILRAYVRRFPDVSHWDILGVEVEFDLTIEGFRFVGRIDRADRVNEDTARVIDLKSNRMLFTRNEVDADLQMSVYAIAARKLWPWAKNVELVFDMLRHDTSQSTARTMPDLHEAAMYIGELGWRTEHDPKYAAKVGPNCGYCAYKHQCDAYKSAMASKRDAFHAPNQADLEEVAAVREQIATLAKLFYKKKDELDTILKAHLEHHDELDLAGHVYRLSYPQSVEYDVLKTCERIVKRTGMEIPHVMSAILSVDNKKLERLLDVVGSECSRSEVLVLRSELEALGQTVNLTPRLSVSKSKRLPASSRASKKGLNGGSLASAAPMLEAANDASANDGDGQP
jgi:hypothetical protein